MRSHQDPDERLPQMGSAVRLFLVDDDEIVLSTLESGLQQRGFEVRSFTTGTAALDAWRLSPPDAAIVDVGLPDIAGGELVARMLASAHRPILALSQYDDHVVVEDLVGRGVMNYLVKPVSANQLVPSVQAMLSTARKLDQLMEQRARTTDGDDENTGQLSAVIDRFSFGVLIIDASHRVVRSNASARRILDLDDVSLSLVNGAIVASDATIETNFKQMVTRGLRSEFDAELGAEVMAVTRFDGASAIQLWAAPLGSNSDFDATSTTPLAEAVIVVMVDPDADIPVATTLLRSLFGLTAAESKLAAALVNGTSIEQYAKKANVSYNTARSHLKSIFVKTRTHRQVDLVMLLSKLLGNLQSGAA